MLRVTVPIVLSIDYDADKNTCEDVLTDLTWIRNRFPTSGTRRLIEEASELAVQWESATVSTDERGMTPQVIRWERKGDEDVAVVAS